MRLDWEHYHFKASKPFLRYKTVSRQTHRLFWNMFFVQNLNQIHTGYSVVGVRCFPAFDAVILTVLLVHSACHPYFFFSYCNFCLANWKTQHSHADNPELHERISEYNPTCDLDALLKIDSRNRFITWKQLTSFVKIKIVQFVPQPIHFEIWPFKKKDPFAC